MKPVKNGFTAAAGVDDAQHRPARVWMLTFAMAVVTALAVVPALTGADGFAMGLLAVGPCLAAVAISPRAVAAVGGYTVALGAGLSWSSDSSTTAAHKVGHVLALAAVSVLSVVIGRRRRILENAAGQGAADRRLLAAVVESSDDAIVTRTLDKSIMTWNAGAERMFGYRADEAVGAYITLITPEGEMAELSTLLGVVAQGEKVDHYETKRVRKDGVVLDVSVSLSVAR